MTKLALALKKEEENKYERDNYSLKTNCEKTSASVTKATSVTNVIQLSRLGLS